MMYQASSISMPYFWSSDTLCKVGWALAFTSGNQEVTTPGEFRWPCNAHGLFSCLADYTGFRNHRVGWSWMIASTKQKLSFNAFIPPPKIAPMMSMHLRNFIRFRNRFWSTEHWEVPGYICSRSRVIERERSWRLGRRVLFSALEFWLLTVSHEIIWRIGSWLQT